MATTIVLIVVVLYVFSKMAAQLWIMFAAIVKFKTCKHTVVYLVVCLITVHYILTYLANLWMLLLALLSPELCLNGLRVPHYLTMLTLGGLGTSIQTLLNLLSASNLSCKQKVTLLSSLPRLLKSFCLRKHLYWVL